MIKILKYFLITTISIILLVAVAGFLKFNFTDSDIYLEDGTPINSIK